MNARHAADAGELFAILDDLEARGLITLEQNDLGELRAAPTVAGLAAVRDYGEETEMEASARVCVVSNCPAMAAPGLDTCQVHARGRLFGVGHPATSCRRCQRRVKATDWITPATFDDGTVEHVHCPIAIRNDAAKAAV